VPAWKALDVNLPLMVNAGRSHLTKVDLQRGKPAETSFKIVAEKLDACLLECQPKTGYRHQIRAHLYAQGMGILGDVLYKPLKETTFRAGTPRLMLQAQALQFCHPNTKQSASFSLVLDPELELYWNTLSATT
jgi:23S rRNA-/tRNA-specific pseudouridylate synthase